MNPYEIDLSIYKSDMTRVKVRETASKMFQHFRDHEAILISVSGGADSDCIVHLVCKYFPEHLHKMHFVFVNTGLEYDATKRHLTDLESKYGIQIHRLRGRPVPAVVREYGVPILSKLKAHIIDAYIRGTTWGGQWLRGEKIRGGKDGSGYHALVFTENQRQLAEYCKEHGIKVSSKCCDLSKKKPLFKYMKENGIDLDVTGERKAEGGQRALAHRTCFESHENKADKYMPLFWWEDDDKADFVQTEGIIHSDCYTVYGMRRTGCCGCPFALDIAENLRTMRIYEPKLYKACMSVFGEAYRLTDMFEARRKKCIPDEQMMLVQEAMAQEAERGA